MVIKSYNNLLLRSTISSPLQTPLTIGLMATTGETNKEIIRDNQLTCLPLLLIGRCSTCCTWTENATVPQIPAARQHFTALTEPRTHDRMVPAGKRKSATFYLTAAVILTSYFAQTSDCVWLKKAGRRGGRKEANGAGTLAVQEGKIVFGRVFEKGSGLESQVIDGTKKSSSNASLEDDANYQADSPGKNLFLNVRDPGFFVAPKKNNHNGL